MARLLRSAIVDGPEEAGTVLCADGKVRAMAEVQRAADGGWEMRDVRGSVWYCAPVGPELTLTQDADVATRWHIFDVVTGEYVESARIFDLGATVAKMAQARLPQVYQGWTWSGGRGVSSLAEVGRNCEARAMSVAGAESQRRAQGY